MKVVRVPSGIKSDDVFEVILDLRPYSVICPVETEGGDFIAVMAPPPIPFTLTPPAPTVTSTATIDTTSSTCSNTSASIVAPLPLPPFTPALISVPALTMSSTTSTSISITVTSDVTSASATHMSVTTSACSAVSSSTDAHTPRITSSSLLSSQSQLLLDSPASPSSSTPNLGKEEIDNCDGDEVSPEAPLSIARTGVCDDTVTDVVATAAAGVVEELYMESPTQGTPQPPPSLSVSTTPSNPFNPSVPSSPTVLKSNIELLNGVKLKGNTDKCEVPMHTDMHTDTDTGKSTDIDVGKGGGIAEVDSSSARQNGAGHFISEVFSDIAATGNSTSQYAGKSGGCDLSSNYKNNEDRIDVTGDCSMKSQLTGSESTVMGSPSKQLTNTDRRKCDHIGVIVSGEKVEEEEEEVKENLLDVESTSSVNRPLSTTCTPPLDVMTSVEEKNRSNLITDLDPHSAILKYEEKEVDLKSEKEGELKSRGCEVDEVDIDMSVIVPCRRSPAPFKSAISTENETDTITCPLCTFENDGEVETECIPEDNGEGFNTISSSSVNSIGRKMVIATFCRVCGQDLRGNALPPIAVPIPLATPSLTVISSLR